MPRHPISTSVLPLGRIGLAACLAGLLMATASQAQTQTSSPQEASQAEAAPSPPTTETTRVENERRGSRTTTVIRDGRRIERITVEDAGSRVDELREGGETRKITVQPKNNAPSYDVRPPDSGAGSRGREGASGNAGERSWKLFQF
jgi:hypothetical protein